MISKGLYGKKYLDIQVREQEIAAPGDDHVIVKVHACGVCGTDLNFVKDWPDDYMALGHEIAAEVLEVGKNVTTVAPGDRVIIEDVSMCGICDDCKSGHPEFCRNLFSIEGQPGMGQYMSVRYNSCVKFEGLDYVSACLTEPLAVSLTSVINADIPLGGSVLVLGPGPLGLMSARLAKLRGAGFVAITGLNADNARREGAPGHGAGIRLRHGDRGRQAGRGRGDQAPLPEGRGSGDRQLAAAEHGRCAEGHPLRRADHLLRHPLRRPEHGQHRHQRPDLPQDHPGADLRRAGDQLPDLEPAAERWAWWTLRRS